MEQHYFLVYVARRVGVGYFEKLLQTVDPGRFVGIPQAIVVSQHT